MNPLTIILLALTLGLGIYAQFRLNAVYKKFSQVPSRNRLSGHDAARYVLRNAGVEGVEIVPVGGVLSDHYDTRNRRLALSEDTYGGTSIAAIGVAAHEAGHAIQHAQGFRPLQLRMSLLPVTAICSKALPAIIGASFLVPPAAPFVIKGCILCYIVVMVFQLITLPVEFDASRRAKLQLASIGLITPEELPSVQRTLHAAGFTYVAAFIAVFVHLARLVFFRGRVRV